MRATPITDAFKCWGCDSIYESYDFCEECIDYCLNCCDGHGPWCDGCQQEVNELIDGVCEECWTPRCPRCASKNTRLNAHMILKCNTCNKDWEADLLIEKWVQVIRSAANARPMKFRMDMNTRQFMLRTYRSSTYLRTKEGEGTDSKKTEPKQQQEIQMHSYEIEALKGHIDRCLEVLTQAESLRDQLREEHKEKAKEAVSQALAEGAFRTAEGKEIDVSEQSTGSRLSTVASYYSSTPSAPVDLSTERRELDAARIWLDNLSGESVELDNNEYNSRVGFRIDQRKKLDKWVAEHSSDDASE